MTFDEQSGDTPSPTSKSVTYDSTYGTLATTARSGHTFEGWWTGAGGTGTEVTSSTTVAITANQTLYAKWVLLVTTIDVTGSLSALSTTYGTASGSSSVNVSGSDLVANITATAPNSNFEVSSDDSNWGSTATFTESGGTASGTLYVRLSATAPVGNYNDQNIAVTSSGASSVNVPTTSSGNDVAKATPTVTVTVGSYTYNESNQGPDSFTTVPSGDTGAATWSYEGVSGTTYGPSATRPTGAGSYTAQVSLESDANFEASSSSATSFTIAKATPTVDTWPTAGTISSGQTLADSALSGGSANVGGSFAWTTPGTQPSAGTSSQDVTFTPTDTVNYNTVAGTVSVKVLASVVSNGALTIIDNNSFSTIDLSGNVLYAVNCGQAWYNGAPTGANPTLGVDGNWASGSCTHTLPGSDTATGAWWRVDMQLAAGSSLTLTLIRVPAVPFAGSTCSTRGDDE